MLKGVGQNAVYSISTHNPISELGGFQDDAFQNHKHGVTVNSRPVGNGGFYNYVVPTDTTTLNDTTSNVSSGYRTDSTTHDKSVGVHYMIKCFL